MERQRNTESFENTDNTILVFRVPRSVQEGVFSTLKKKAFILKKRQ